MLFLGGSWQETEDHELVIIDHYCLLFDIVLLTGLREGVPGGWLKPVMQGVHRTRIKLPIGRDRELGIKTRGSF